jgi:peroxin-13
MNNQPFSAQRSVAASSVPKNPPPVPARNYLSQRSDLVNGYNGFGYGGSGYSAGYGTGMAGYGGYGTGYSPFGASLHSGMYGGFGMNRFGTDSFSPGSFAHQAEISSRQAFQSVESVVHAVGSVAALLESTFQAVYNSFRAVIGVADHMTRVKMYLGRIFSAVALIRTLRWLVSWLLAVLRFRRPRSSDDQLWSQAAEHITHNVDVDVLQENRSNWPVMIFFAIIIGGPWLVWKFLSSLTTYTAQTSAWATAEDDHYVAVAEFDFTGQNDDELSFAQGAVITIAPKGLRSFTCYQTQCL